MLLFLLSTAFAEYPKPNFPDFLDAEVALAMENIPPEDVTPIVVDVEKGDYNLCDTTGKIKIGIGNKISLRDALRGVVRTFLTKDVAPHPYKIGILVIGVSSMPGFIVPLHPQSETHHIMIKKRKHILSQRKLRI